MPKKVVVIDDDPLILESISDMLEDEGFTTVCLKDGEALFNIIKSFNVHLLILDMWLPGEKGIELAKKIRHNKKMRKVPIIMISAQESVIPFEDRKYIDYFIKKPFSIDDFLGKVNRLV